ncbi:hypothetical protein ERJ75_001670900 [Trypanosoma vivax]|uniref:Uncharacterized protein n=1 Tax=Trypanosoma vivax (strain Y486) TaxID=1055687 RepID=G0U8N1_TRYVY|nr:hypothetical protein TRVL_03554 [Trypanosoma vivax]KAH8604916.1 hypothetical protein ERJ75_001670900 [Trypanosoma vivax]CCC53958.1 conserved hypothetical protein [Trypanosoma vivax Y486]
MSKEKLEALQRLSTLLKDKKDVPEELWAAAEVEPGSRIKVVEQEIVKLKKEISDAIKAQVREEERRALQEEARRQGVRLEDLLEQERQAREYDEAGKNKRERERTAQREKKEAEREEPPDPFGL